MQLRYTFRLYPKPGQVILLAKAFGCARVVFNDAVQARRHAYLTGERFPTSAELQKKLITKAKRMPERVWLADVSHTMLQQAIRDCDTAYRNFFDSLKNRRAGPKVGPPRFRSRHSTRESIRYTGTDFAVKANGRLRLSRVGDLELIWSRELPAKPSSVTIIKDSAGRFFASFVVDIGSPKPLPELETEIGIDLGLRVYAVDSQGRTIENPRFLRNHERRLRRAQQALARKKKASNNRLEARREVARLYAKVRDSRLNWLHQQTTRLIRENQAIYLEDLAVRGLARTHLSKSVYDAAWGTFRRMLEDKASRYGRHVGVIGRFEPTSQMCSGCGHRDGPKPLAVRRWTCFKCGATHDRDINAAKNILALGRRERLNVCGDSVRPEQARAAVDETETHRGADLRGHRPHGTRGRNAGP